MNNWRVAFETAVEDAHGDLAPGGYNEKELKSRFGEMYERMASRARRGEPWNTTNRERLAALKQEVGVGPYRAKAQKGWGESNEEKSLREKIGALAASASQPRRGRRN